jgi:hypothetical protein
MNHRYALAVEPRYVEAWEVGAGPDVTINDDAHDARPAGAVPVRIEFHPPSVTTNVGAAAAGLSPPSPPPSLTLLAPCLLPPWATIRSITVASPSHYPVCLSGEQLRRHGGLIFFLLPFIVIEPFLLFREFQGSFSYLYFLYNFFFIIIFNMVLVVVMVVMMVVVMAMLQVASGYNDDRRVPCSPNVSPKLVSDVNSSSSPPPTLSTISLLRQTMTITTNTITVVWPGPLGSNRSCWATPQWFVPWSGSRRRPAKFRRGAPWCRRQRACGVSGSGWQRRRRARR